MYPTKRFLGAAILVAALAAFAILAAATAGDHDTDTDRPSKITPWSFTAEVDGVMVKIGPPSGYTYCDLRIVNRDESLVRDARLVKLTTYTLNTGQTAHSTCVIWQKTLPNT